MSQTEAYVHGTAPEEQERLSRMNRLINDASLRLLELRPGDRVLDVGAGLMIFSREMAKATGKPVIAVERSEAQIERGLAIARKDGEEALVDVRPGSADALPLRAEEWGTFDVAYSRFLLEHVPDPQAVVKQMARALCPGGRAVLEDDDHDVLRLWPEPEGFRELWQAYMDTYTAIGCDPIVGRRLPELLIGAGLTPSRITWKFYGAVQGTDLFLPHLENLIGVLESTRAALRSAGFPEPELDRICAEIRSLEHHPGAALWFSTCWAEGIAT